LANSDKEACWFFATADCALSTKDSADYSVISVWAVTPAGDIALMHVWREKAEAPEVKEMMVKIFRQWNLRFIGIERAHYGTAMIQAFRRETDPRKRIVVKELIPDKDKETRAINAVVQMENGQIFLPHQADWLVDCERELLTFPNAKHDDFVDTVSYAAIVVRNMIVGVHQAEVEQRTKQRQSEIEGGKVYDPLDHVKHVWELEDDEMVGFV
jgi:predicted phage terminase large subunit-like protein